MRWFRQSRRHSPIQNETVDTLSIPVNTRVREHEDDEQFFETVEDPASEEITIQEMEIIERIKECLAQIQPSKYTSNGASAISVRNTNEAMVALNNALKTLPNEVVRSVVVNELFHVERRRRRKMSRTHLRDFFAKCIKSVLNENQMNELYQILEGLPSAALGDLTAQEQTRVLVNVLQDARTALAEERHQCRYNRNLIDIAAGLIENCLTQRTDAQELLFHMLKHGLDEHQAFRAVLVQILLARIIPPSPTERTAILRHLFPDSVLQSLHNDKNVSK